MNTRIATGAAVVRHSIFTGLFGSRIMHDAQSDAAAGGALELKGLVEGFKKAQDGVREIAEKALAEATKHGGVAEETKKKADEALTSMNTKSAEMDTRLSQIEQKMARPGGASADEIKSVGQIVLENDEVKSLISTGKGKAQVKIDTKTVLSAAGTWGATASRSTSLVAADRAAMVLLPDRRMTVRDLITPGQTASNAIEYPVETVFTNNAAVVAENTRKPESNITFDMRSTTVRTIAHFIKASRQILDDAPMLQTTIDGRLRYGIELAEEAELLYGDGTGQHLLGIIPQATAYTAAFAPTGLTGLDILRLAALQASLALYPATGFVIHPTDWARIELTKDTQGRYLVGDPQANPLNRRLWGLPVVDTQAMAPGTFLTGAFRNGAQLFDRMAIEVLLSTENEDDFVKNMITIRGEERLALAVYRPAAFITGSIIPV